MLRPEIAVITNIAEAHFKNFNTLKDIAKAKAEIIDNISESGSIILNKDDKFFNFLSNKAKKKGIFVVSFSHKQKADIFLLKTTKNKNHYKLKVVAKNKIFYFNITQYTENFIK